MESKVSLPHAQVLTVLYKYRHSVGYLLHTIPYHPAASF